MDTTRIKKERPSPHEGAGQSTAEAMRGGKGCACRPGTCAMGTWAYCELRAANDGLMGWVSAYEAVHGSSLLLLNQVRPVLAPVMRAKLLPRDLVRAEMALQSEAVMRRERTRIGAGPREDVATVLVAEDSGNFGLTPREGHNLGVSCCMGHEP